MPDREYYLASSPRMTDVRDKYQTHIARMFALAGYDDARARAWRVFALEKKLANAHVSREHTEDVKKGNNHLTRAQLAEQAVVGGDKLLGLGRASRTAPRHRGLADPVEQFCHFALRHVRDPFRWSGTSPPIRRSVPRGSSCR